MARGMDLDPCGSAGSYAGFLLVALPLPWPRDISEAARLDDHVADARRNGLRLQAVAGDGAEPGQVVRYLADGGGYRSSADGRHVLICTHGSRDRCCGSTGTRLHSALQRRWDRPDLLWRTSHLGGHRFAPTALILPEGTMWAFLDPGLLEGIVDRSVAVAVAARHYRGSPRIAGAPLQLADRLAFEQVGWSWLDEERHGHHHVDDSGDVVASIHSATRRFVVRLEQTRRVPVLSCGVALDGAATEPQYRVVEHTVE